VGHTGQDDLAGVATDDAPEGVHRRRFVCAAISVAEALAWHAAQPRVLSPDCFASDQDEQRQRQLQLLAAIDVQRKLQSQKRPSAGGVFTEAPVDHTDGCCVHHTLDSSRERGDHTHADAVRAADGEFTALHAAAQQLLNTYRDLQGLGQGRATIVPSHS
jgi:UDP-N-acetylenolpyruvoylglucosamine reductase